MDNVELLQRMESLEKKFKEHVHNGIDSQTVNSMSAGTGIEISGNTISVADLTTAELAASTLVTESETIASNDNDTTIPTSAAVNDAISDAVQYTVNTDTVHDWYTIQLRAPHNLTGTEWTLSAGGSWVEYATGETSTVSSSGGTDVQAHTTNFYRIGTGAQLTFASSTYWRIKCAFSIYAGEGTNETNDKFGFFGLTGGSTSTAYGYISNTGRERIGFSFYDQQIYATTCNGTAVTNTSVLNYTGSGLGAIHTYEIVKEGTTSVKFYIDGVLEATHTTNIPDSSGTANVQFSSYIGTTYDASGFGFISHLVWSEKVL